MHGFLLDFLTLRDRATIWVDILTPSPTGCNTIHKTACDLIRSQAVFPPRRLDRLPSQLVVSW